MTRVLGLILTPLVLIDGLLTRNPPSPYRRTS
jgi:hypothetical protein